MTCRLFLSITLALLIMAVQPITAQSVGQPLALWQEGQLDIHHINTGRGNATFCILPDGTTLLIDAGAIDPIDWRTNKPRTNPIKPGNDRQPGEWIARYVLNALSFQKTPVLDYVIITHFHDDHLGTPRHTAKKSATGYGLSGITEVAEYIPIRKIIDRGWPDYNYPAALAKDSIVINYRQFLRHQIQAKQVSVERFNAGRFNQIRLVKQPGNYANQFEIRNLAVNGNVWTGNGETSRSLFPDLATIPQTHQPNENMCSIAFKLRYGAFDYFAGGDIQGVVAFGAPAWHDVETPISQVTGPVDVQVLDHHGYADSQNGALLAALKPRVFVVPAWAVSHPAAEVLERVFSEQTYAGERDVFVTQLLPDTKQTLGELANRLQHELGHVVIRVKPGGGSYQVIILDDTNESFRVKAVYGPYLAR